MGATLILRTKTISADGRIVEKVLWRVPQPVPGSEHSHKYRLFCGNASLCLVRYDNESGKGDHRHRGGGESPYEFRGIASLLADFDADVARLTAAKE